MFNFFLNLTPVAVLAVIGWQVVTFFMKLTTIHQASIDAALSAAGVK